MKRIFSISIVLCLACFCQVWAQRGVPRELRKTLAADEEIVSFSETTSFINAMEILNDLSKKYLNKIIVDPDSRSHAIGIDINQMHWLTALELILRQNGLWYEQFQEYIKIIPINENVENLSEEEREVIERFRTREVSISAVFFEADVSRLREMGMSWLLKRGSDLNLTATNLSSGGINLNQGQNQTGDTGTGTTSGNEQQQQQAGKLFQIKIEPGNLRFGDVIATFDALESNNAGEVIASPQVTVGSGEDGRIQVGTDVGVTVQDFAGNSVTQFFSTGSIIKVKPLVIVHDSIPFIFLDLEIERSSGSRDANGGVEIRKSQAKTKIMLLDGEETIIGGLHINETSNSRAGVPFLKDLPWWFFGLRYFFGYESSSVVKKELLILIHAELLPTLQDRYNAKAEGIEEKMLLKKAREENQRRMEHYRSQVAPEEKK